MPFSWQVEKSLHVHFRYQWLQLEPELVHRLSARRPDLAVSFRPSMRVTHVEFSSGMGRAQRLRLYRQTNSRVETFRELGPIQRISVLARMLRGSRAS